jgi:tight adherence protein C
MDVLTEYFIRAMQTLGGWAQSNDARIIMASILAGLASLLVAYGLLREHRYQEIQRRLHQMAERTQETGLETEMGSFADRILKPASRSLLAMLGRLTPGSNLESLRRQLVLAGNPYNLAVIDLLGLKMLAGIGTALLATFYFYQLTDLPKFSATLFSLTCGGVGMYLPNYWLKMKRQKRQDEMIKALPNALDMLTTMVDAGLGFDMALLRLSARWHNALTQDFERMVNEMNMGVRRSDALRNLAERNDIPEIRAFVAVLIQADSLGISIADILHTQSEQMRLRRRQRAEEKANKMPIKLLPIITIFIFPALFAVILGPAIPGVLNALSGA